MKYLKLELKVLVGCLFCNLLVWLLYKWNGNEEIRIVEIWLRSYRALVTVGFKSPWGYLDFLNGAIFSEGVECIF